MQATRGSNKRGREEDERSDAPAAEFLGRLRGTPVWKKPRKEVKGLDDVEIDDISALPYRGEESGNPGGRLPPLFGPSSTAMATMRMTTPWDNDGMSDDKFDEEEDGDAADSVVADPDAWEAVEGSTPATLFSRWRVYLCTGRVLNSMVRMRIMDVDPFDADAPIRGAGVRGNMSRADPEGEEETRDNANALAERLLEMDERELLEFYELAESYREDLLEQGVNTKEHNHD
ncbi:hypothetical protein DL765_002503 [Monosporascus sp. GIB2]|nr:hypothetical protein DL765_002503 [Monosporascus sp. GIB2]